MEAPGAAELRLLRPAGCGQAQARGLRRRRELRTRGWRRPRAPQSGARRMRNNCCGAGLAQPPAGRLSARVCGCVVAGASGGARAGIHRVCVCRSVPSTPKPRARPYRHFGRRIARLDHHRRRRALTAVATPARRPPTSRRRALRYFYFCAPRATPARRRRPGADADDAAKSLFTSPPAALWAARTRLRGGERSGPAPAVGAPSCQRRAPLTRGADAALKRGDRVSPPCSARSWPPARRRGRRRPA